MTNFSRTAIFLAAGSALALGACSREAPDDLPPPPVGATGPETAPPAPTGPAPGSREDFLANAASDTIFFETDSYDIDPEDRAILDSQARWLVTNPGVRVTIEGHCDERGTREYNLALGERRANAASNYLAARGVDASRMTVISYGKERPVALGSDPASWAQNRRAVTIVPIG
ncbi:peptidoglycan-associated lipoprotein Pal [Parasphingopyxis algicola]|uniref:peptidoglycan-associated lipoprotein Pal n=1 Tax=Parasphingopyxis algicola TaxID=2026624 RepID=UPI0015A2A6CB|nr:peptidoglycan-associated lipoprotein Pal [Parasphingopyxis algicola]QLC25463.1 peptidoglycan-associated lipoprotein Pal [Parasphingopyxis algicola]